MQSVARRGDVLAMELTTQAGNFEQKLITNARRKRAADQPSQIKAGAGQNKRINMQNSFTAGDECIGYF
ncbi:MAG: hypothetical protein ACRED2_00515 [Methylocella sp.]